MADGSPEPKAALFLALAAMNAAAIGMYWYARSMKNKKTPHSPCTICGSCKKLLEKSTKATSTSGNLFRYRRPKLIGQLFKTAKKHRSKKSNEVTFLASGEGRKPVIVQNVEIPAEHLHVTPSQEQLDISNVDLKTVKGIIRTTPTAQNNQNLSFKLKEALSNSYESTTTFFQLMGEKCFPTRDRLNGVDDALRLEKQLDTYTEVMVDTLVTTICNTAERISESQQALNTHQNQIQVPPMVSQNVYNTVVLYSKICDPIGMHIVQSEDLQGSSGSTVIQFADEMVNNARFCILDENDGAPTCLRISGHDSGAENCLGTLKNIHNLNARYTNIDHESSTTQNRNRLAIPSPKCQGSRPSNFENDGRLESPDHLFSIVLKLLESWNKRRPDIEKSAPTILEERDNFLMVEDLLNGLISDLELDSKNCPIMRTLDSSLLCVGDSQSNENRSCSSDDRQFVIWGQSPLEKKEHDTEKSCPYLFFGSRAIRKADEEKIPLVRYISQESIHSWGESITEGEFYECDPDDLNESRSDLFANNTSAMSFSRRSNNTDECWNDCIGGQNGPEFTENPSTCQQLLEFFGPDSIQLGSPAFFEEVAKEYQGNKLE